MGGAFATPSRSRSARAWPICGSGAQHPDECRENFLHLIAFVGKHQIRIHIVHDKRIVRLEDHQAAIQAFVGLARRVKPQFYMPTSVYEELGKVKDLAAVAADFESVVRIRSPRKFKLMIPGEILYEFIEEVRTRIDRGLRIARPSRRSNRSGGLPRPVARVDRSP